ncbi:MAG TPA: hypothetical protein VFQ00_10755 [Terriglobales bacterium]|nr:hypothetical protein [Terriglobales bacterium]
MLRAMLNYFNYFTEIEEHFQRRRGTLLLLSTLDWALIETWKEAGIPLEAVLRGIDVSFDHYERRPRKTRKVNGLAFCAQEVLAGAEEMKEAGVGSKRNQEARDTGLSAERVSSYLNDNAAALERANLSSVAADAAKEGVASLRSMAEELKARSGASLHLEDVERRLTVLEEKLYAALLATTPEADLLAIRTDADRQIAAYRSKMSAAQIGQLQKQFLHKRLLEMYSLPRLSLFYL